jgi:hypothetical protein
MTNQHPITPPPELVQQWWTDAQTLESTDSHEIRFIANVAARWGADQELEACCEWLENNDCDDPQEVAIRLRAARRPKSPSLKEQALALLEVELGLNVEDLDLLRRALEALPND